MNIATIQPFFSQPLVDLSCEGSKYSAVYSPEPELGRPRHGVSAEFLERSEQYFEKYEHYDYIFGLIKRELDTLRIVPAGLAVDFGCGFGNTIIPILEHYPDLAIIGVDISPDLLSILNREVRTRALSERCAAVAMDAQRDYFAADFADIVFGGAVLHHMIDPGKVVETTIKVLKPGGHAIFLEPFENGHSILRLAYDEILAEAKRREESGPGFKFLEALSVDIAVRTHRDAHPGFEHVWANLDDKWMFTRTYFERIAREKGAQSVRIRSLHDNKNCFTRQAHTALTEYGRLKCPDALPTWAWTILDRYDKLFSEDLKQELIIEGSVVFTK